MFPKTNASFKSPSFPSHTRLGLSPFIYSQYLLRRIKSEGRCVVSCRWKKKTGWAAVSHWWWQSWQSEEKVGVWCEWLLNQKPCRWRKVSSAKYRLGDMRNSVRMSQNYGLRGRKTERKKSRESQRINKEILDSFSTKKCFRHSILDFVFSLKSWVDVFIYHKFNLRSLHVA